MIPTRQRPVYRIFRIDYQELFALNAKNFMPLFRRYQIGMDCPFVVVAIIIIIIIIIKTLSAIHPAQPRPIHFLIVSFFQTQPQVAVSAPISKIRPMCARYPCFWCYAVLRLMQYHLCYSSLLCCSSCPFILPDNHFVLSPTTFSLLCTAKTLHFTVAFTGFRDFDLF